MERRAFLTGIMAVLATPAVAQPASVADQIITMLRDQGYTEIRISRTWLGRVRILAVSDQYWREIIISPRTGEILRDYWEPVAPDGSSPSGYFDREELEDGDDEDDSGNGNDNDQSNDDDNDSNDDDSNDDDSNDDDSDDDNGEGEDDSSDDSDDGDDD